MNPEKVLLSSFIEQQILAAAAFSRQLPKPKTIFWMGMGGSALGALVWQDYQQNRLSHPFWVWSQPETPAFLTPETTIIVSSYSGATRETISFYRHIRGHYPHIYGLTSGGELARLFRHDKIPFLLLDPKLNPLGQPRYGVGFSLGFLAGLFPKLGQDLIAASQNFSFTPPPEASFNYLQKQAIFLILARTPFWGLAQFWQNHFQETGKRLTFAVRDPEMRHHLPEALYRHHLPVIILAPKDKPFAPLVAWFKKEKIPFYFWKIPSCHTTAQQILWGIHSGQYLAFRLAKKQNINPLEIPSISWIKHFNTNRQ